MFDRLPNDPADLTDADDAAVIAAIGGWDRIAAAAEARKLAAIALLTNRREPAEHPDWACDDWDATAAEIAAELNIGHGRAFRQLDLALTLRDRLPRVGALFASGQVGARTVAVIAARTALVKDADFLARLDEVIAERAVSWGPLSEYKLTRALDVWIDAIDPGALRQTRSSARDRDVVIGDARDTTGGTTGLAGRLLSPDAALLEQRLSTMARSVCPDDPRTLAQRRADALGALAAGSTHLACRCEAPDCPAADDDGRATSIMVHIVADASVAAAPPDPKINGEHSEPFPEPAAPPAPQRPPAGLIIGGGIVPTPLLADLIAHGARQKGVRTPCDAAEPRYRPSAALDEFVRLRDMTCRFPGCDRPATAADIDHTVPWPAGATHSANLKTYCRKHHLLKTFWPGWSERQHADGTLDLTTPSGHTYTTKPGATLLLPAWNGSAPLRPGPQTPAPDGDARTLMMPRRKRTRAKSREYRINAERALNDARVAERNMPPPF